MRKTIAASLACALCYGAAFGFDLMGFVKDTIGIESGVTAGFSRDDRREVVKDDIYKLMWQDGEEIFKGTYDEAVKYCENLSFAGYDDWRLPRVNELISITDKSKFAPAINSAFKHAANDGYLIYWSSTEISYAPPSIWRINFNYGVGISCGKSSCESDTCFVRCVRSY